MDLYCWRAGKELSRRGLIRQHHIASLTLVFEGALKPCLIRLDTPCWRGVGGHANAVEVMQHNVWEDLPKIGQARRLSRATGANQEEQQAQFVSMQHAK